MALSSLWRRRFGALVTAAAVLTPTTNALAQAPAPPQPAPAPPTPAPAATASTPVKIATTDGKGLVYIDGKLAGEGSFQGELGSGSHELKITRDGYDTVVEQLVVQGKDPVNKSYTLNLSANVKTEQVATEVDRPEGVYGGFVLNGFLTPGGTGNSIEQQCDRKGELPTLKSCDTPGGLGGGLGGYVGYHWDPVGIELYVAGSYDTRTDKESWASSATLGGIKSNPARDEEYDIRRAGGMALFRVRLTKQWTKLRLTFPFGAGVALRVMNLHRVARSTEPPVGQTDSFSPDSKTYVSPAIQFEPTVAYRLTPGVAVTLGVQFYLEAPAAFSRDNPTTKNAPNHTLGASGISTPAYQLASNAQIFIGPVIGMMFGP